MIQKWTNRLQTVKKKKYLRKVELERLAEIEREIPESELVWELTTQKIMKIRPVKMVWPCTKDE